MKILALLLLLPSLAFGQGWANGPPGASQERVTRRWAFNTPGCYPTGGTVGFGRASTATYVDGSGTVQTCATGLYRVASQGYLVEFGSTNYLLNSGTHPKTTEATAALSAGSHVAWQVGGTLTVVAGTATVTGLACSGVASGVVCPFTVTVGGTVLVTTSAGTTRAQVEPLAFRTSYIPTTAGAVARSSDNMNSLGFPTLTPNWCLAATYQPADGRSWATTIGGGFRMMQGGPDGGINSFRLRQSPPDLIFEVYDSAAGAKQVAASGITGTLADGSAQRIVICNASGTLTMSINGVVVSGATSGAGTGLWTASPSDMGIGQTQGAGFQFTGYIKDLNICAATANYRNCK